MPDADLTRYLVLLVDYADPAKRGWGDFDDAQQAAVMAQHEDFDRAVADHPTTTIVAAEALAGGEDATVLRRHDGRTVLTEGSFAESVEQIGGFYLIDAPDLDTLVSLLEIMPTYVMEIRPTADV
ncbi:YciI family protein [Kytococcus sedentarius]|uniref:YciI family protein n=1 Tax=Kytococcus sedentarius TaxID=1276 RepID=UPI00384C727F